MTKNPSIVRTSALAFAVTAVLGFSSAQAEDVSNPGNDHQNASSTKSGTEAIEHERVCRHDYNEDGVVDFDDFLQLLNRWASWNPVTSEVTVNFEDIVGLLSEWGSC